jgi:hypothetical protein
MNEVLSSDFVVINLPFNDPHPYALIPASGGRERAVRAESDGFHGVGVNLLNPQRLVFSIFSLDSM